MLITVFTPTYNRAELLERCFNSLLSQTSKNFCWLIIDDGSTDNTRSKVSEWINKCKDFEIKYIYKTNGGLYTAYNEAIANIDTELSVCIDSDDYMPNDAIEKIEKFWNTNETEKYAGIAGLDYYIDGSVVGEKFPNKKEINIIDLLVKGEAKGDKKYVVKTELYKKFSPMKVFEGEKNFNPHYLHIEISKEYNFLTLNENLCFIEYQPNGMTRNIFKQYYDSPNSFLETRIQYLSIKKSKMLFIIKNAIHYNSSCILAKKYKDIINRSPRKALTIITFPIGLIFSLYVRYRAMKQIRGTN